MRTESSVHCQTYSIPAPDGLAVKVSKGGKLNPCFFDSKLHSLNPPTHSANRLRTPAFHYHSSLVGSNVVNTVIRYWPPLEIHVFGAIVLLGMFFHKQASNSVLPYLHQHFSTNKGNRHPRLSFCYPSAFRQVCF